MEQKEVKKEVNYKSFNPKINRKEI